LTVNVYTGDIVFTPTHVFVPSHAAFNSTRASLGAVIEPFIKAAPFTSNVVG